MKSFYLVAGLALGLVGHLSAAVPSKQKINDFRAKLLAQSASELEGKAAAPESPDTLWYRQPARNWNEALPIGNGRIGATCDTPITSVDYLPTFAELAGASLAGSKYPVDGVSLLPLMKGERIPERAIFWHFPLYANIDHSVAPGTQPVFGTDQLYWRGVPTTVIRRGKYKLLYYYEDQSFKLFDVVNDIGESKDLATTHPEIAAGLLKELKAWTKAVEAPVPDKVNPAFKPNQ